MVKPSINQTKEWRKSQSWYINGKHNECEKYQISLIEKITKTKVNKTNKRINLKTSKLEDVKKKMNILEWTENFDGYQLNNEKTIYYNLKMICGSGGGQTRALREVYHFVMAQKGYLKKYKDSNVLFVNILDGDYCAKKIKLLKEFENEQIFIGSMSELNNMHWLFDKECPEA